MRRLLVPLCVAAVAAVVWGAVFLLSPTGDQEPVRQRLAVAPTRVSESVITDASGEEIGKLSADCADDRYAAFCRRVHEELSAVDPRLLTRGGLVVTTTMDGRAQEAAQRAIDARVRSSDGPVAAEAMVVPGTGEIRALAASRGDGAHQLQQGPTAMAYTLAAALANGLRYDDGFPHTLGYRASGYAAFKNCKDQAVGDPSFTITNPGSERRDGEFVTLRAGVREALNTFFMRLEEKAGLCETVRTARRLGLARSGGVALSEYEAFTLGVNEVDLVSVANSYATLAARGTRCEPTAVKEVRDMSGKVLRAFAPRCEQALDPAVADAVTGLLRTGGLGRDAAGLPGTTDGYAAAWYAGYTPALAAAVNLGFPDDPMRHRLTDVTLAGHRHASVEGTTIPLPIWRASMTEALRGTPESAFTRPDEERFGGCRLACPK
ncbi:MAG: hypothetical protein HOV86_14455 [Thermoactinospora sp.]|nr:hypothetical protein [Thermoactinospora sp.]